MKIIGQDNGIIQSSDLSDGQIAQIVSGTNPDYIGDIVQRHGEILVNLGKIKGHSWSNPYPSKLRVRVLPMGTKLEI